MRVCLYLAVHQRHELVKTVQEGILALKESCPYELDVLTIWSDIEDYYLWAGISDILVQRENRPLGRKFNAGIPYVIEGDYDYILQIGCDDVIHPDYWAYVSEFIKKRVHMFGCTKLRVVDWATKEEAIVSCISPFGAGRMTRVDLIKKAYKKLGHIWDIDREKGLDYNSEDNILIYGTELHKKGLSGAIGIAENKVLVTDYKTNDNIHPFDNPFS